jgi:positive regulator of sigma E activity
MLKEGIVSKADKNLATVLIKTQNACDTCRAECGGHCDKAKLYEITLPNTINAKVGDRVEVYSKTQTIMLYSILVFLLPLLLCFLVLIPLSIKISSPLILTLVGALTFFVVFTILHFAFRSKKPSEIFSLVRIVK